MSFWPRSRTRDEIPKEDGTGDNIPDKKDDIEPTAAEIAALKKENAEMKAIMQKLEASMGQQGGYLQGLAASINIPNSGNQPPEDPFEIPNIPDEKWDDLSNKDMMSLISQMMKKVVDSNNNTIMGELKKMQQHSNSQYGSSEKNRLMRQYPDFMEWEKEMLDYMNKLGKGSQFSPDEIYKMVRLQNTEKTKELDKKYGMSGDGNFDQFRWGSFPSQKAEDPIFEIKPFDPNQGTTVYEQIQESVADYQKFRNANSIGDILDAEDSEFF